MWCISSTQFQMPRHFSFGLSFFFCGDYLHVLRITCHNHTLNPTITYKTALSLISQCYTNHSILWGIPCHNVTKKFTFFVGVLHQIRAQKTLAEGNVWEYKRFKLMFFNHSFVCTLFQVVLRKKKILWEFSLHFDSKKLWWNTTYSMCIL